MSSRVGLGVRRPVEDVAWGGEQVTEQFVTAGEPDSFDQVFDYGDRQVYEFDREADSCPCALIERTVGPVADVRAADGRLRATVHAADVPELRELLGELESAYGNVGVEYLVHSADGDGSKLVPVDLRRLTDRQREVFATAPPDGVTSRIPARRTPATSPTGSGSSGPRSRSTSPPPSGSCCRSSSRRIRKGDTARCRAVTV